MNHKKLYEVFCATFPLDQLANGGVESWFPNGRSSIRIRDIHKNEFIFTYKGPQDWKFETMDCYLRNL